MIQDPKVAEEVNKKVLEINRLLNELVAYVNQNSPPEEEKRFRHAVGSVLGELLLEIVNPLYCQHPELKPPEMG